MAGAIGEGMSRHGGNPSRLVIFKQALADLGYIEGKTVRLEYRLAKVDKDYPRLITELID